MRTSTTTASPWEDTFFSVRLQPFYPCHHSSVGTVTRLRNGSLRNRGSIPGKGKRSPSLLFFSVQRPDLLWCPLILPFHWYLSFFLRGKEAGAWIWPVTQGRIKLFGAPRQWKYFRPLFQAVFLSGRGGGYYPPDWVKHHASQYQDRNNKYFILYIEFCINNKI